MSRAAYERQAADWQAQACHLKDHAALPHLTAAQANSLLVQGDMADAMAKNWLNGADADFGKVS